ncbi:MULTISPECIES: hypothetical protein [unclassified Paenibacillus]|uniref:hypothetical protein n=1 Tax=unclassified Paenibacillus TaxID=185978 RepID=UPI0024BB0BB8|nr:MULTISPECIES: hypothetical protein [unclassified Paenibacillus]
MGREKRFADTLESIVEEIEVSVLRELAVNRSLKKLEGITPGGYRKMKIRPQQGIDCGRAAE